MDRISGSSPTLSSNLFLEDVFGAIKAVEVLVFNHGDVGGLEAVMEDVVDVGDKLKAAGDELDSVLTCGVGFWEVAVPVALVAV